VKKKKNIIRISNKFRVETFYVIIDKLITEMHKRIEAYAHITEIFGFSCNLLTMDKDEIKIKAQNLVKIYHKDLQIDLICELEQFVPMIKL